MVLRSTSLLSVAAVAGIASSAQALVWTDVNVADANTIALYHFDENTGASAASTVAGRPNINLSSGTWSSDDAWLASGAGSSLTNAAGTAASYIGRTETLQSIDWSLPGITFSFWMKDTVNFDKDNQAIYLGEDGWRNVQSYFGYHAQWANAVLRHDGVNGPERNGITYLGTIVDGGWHHVGLVFDNATDMASVYVDNAKQVEWSTAGGLNSVVNEFMYVGMSGGSIDELMIQGAVVTDFANGLGNAVPEPASLAVLGLAGLALARRRQA